MFKAQSGLKEEDENFAEEFEDLTFKEDEEIEEEDN